MSRNFTPDHVLIDQLLMDDTSAFEELHHRYCYSLFTYCMGKVHSIEDSKQIVRDIFISLWEKRYTLPVDFSISLYLYTEVRKAVVKCVNSKLLQTESARVIEKQVLPGFSLDHLQQARQPVRPLKLKPSHNHYSVYHKDSNDMPWWNKYPAGLRMQNIKHALQSMLNFL